MTKKQILDKYKSLRKKAEATPAENLRQEAEKIVYCSVLDIFIKDLESLELKPSRKLTYTLAELRKECRQFQVYAGRHELMDEATKKRYDEFRRKCDVYDKEKGVDKLLRRK